MEDFALDVMIGKGPSARSLRLSLKPFTIVGATTRAGRISQPAARPLRGHVPAGLLRRGGPDRHRGAVGAAARRGAEPGRRHGHRPARAGHAARREPPPAPRPRLRPDQRRRPRGRRDRGQGPGRARDRRRRAWTERTASSWPRSSRSSAAGRSACRPWRPSWRRSRRRSRTSTSRSCCASASWIARRRVASPRTAPASTWPAWASRSRRSVGRIRISRLSGTAPPAKSNRPP